MYGSDADLMLLDLMIHEPHFTLVREVVVFGGPRKGKDDNAKKIIARQTKEQEWQLVHLSLFRQYLNVELRAEVRLHIYVSFDVTFLLIGRMVRYGTSFGRLYIFDIFVGKRFYSP